MPPSAPDTETSVLVLGARGEQTYIVTNWLARHFQRVALVIEDPLPKRTLLRGLVRHYGLVTALGQFLHAAVIVPPLRALSRPRMLEIMDAYHLDPSPPPVETFRVPSVNSDAVRQVIASVAPSVVVVHDTRIVGKKTVDAIGVPIINTHMGVTPLYRGVHGGYWALAERRKDLVGTTIVLVAEGIDTGTVLAQVPFEPDRRDSIVTYPLLHLATALPALSDAVREVAAGRVQAKRNPLGLASQLRTHPTVWGYLYRWARWRVR